MEKIEKNKKVVIISAPYIVAYYDNVEECHGSRSAIDSALSAHNSKGRWARPIQFSHFEDGIAIGRDLTNGELVECTWLKGTTK